MSTTLQLVITIIGSGAFFSFVQFLIQRRDKQKEDAKEQQIIQLRQDFQDGLAQREATGLQRYTEHQDSIKKLIQAIEQLTKNDTAITTYMHAVGDELMGMAHAKLIEMTDHIAERGSVTLKELATLEAIYRPYHDDLGGNGDGKAGYEYVVKLPVVSEDKAKEKDKQIEEANKQ